VANKARSIKYQTAWDYIPEVSILHGHCCENLKFNSIFSNFLYNISEKILRNSIIWILVKLAGVQFIVLLLPPRWVKLFFGML
jgi:hypothetical protein